MTEETPDKMDIRIEEDDVLKSANTILNAMSGIREEFFQENKTIMEKEQEKVDENLLKLKDDEEEYLHMTYRLASIIESLEGTEQNTENIIKSIKEEPALFGYDYMQAPFWKEKLPEVDKSLDRLLIRIRRENLSTMKEKHHIMQAVKYLAVKDEEAEKKKDSLDNILPFSSNATKKNKAFFEKEFERLSLKKLKRENAVVKLNGDRNLEQMIDVASSLGFPKLQLVTTTKRYEDMRENKMPVRIVDAPLESRLNEEAYEGKRRFFRKVMPKIKWLTYPILGNMPKSLKRRLEEYVGEDSFNPWSAALTSAITNIAPYAYLMYRILDKGIQGGPYEDLCILIGVCSSIYFAAETVIRAMITGDRGSEGPLASGIGKILLFPFEAYMKRRAMRSSRPIVVEIDLSNKERERLIDRTDYFQHLNGLACKEVDEKGEKNLVWSEKNHHSFGTHFAFDLLKNSEIKNCKPLFDTKNEMFHYYSSREFDGYTNLSALACKKDERYTLSSVSQKKPEMQEINQMLKSDQTTEEKLKNIAERYDPDFIRLVKYKDCIKIDDYEMVK